MCEYARWILNSAERRSRWGKMSRHSHIRQSSILDGSEMENRNCRNHNWKRNWSRKKQTQSCVESLLVRFQVVFFCYVWENMHYPSVCNCVTFIEDSQCGNVRGFLFYCYWSMKSVIAAHIFFHLRELCHLTLVFQNILDCGKVNKENPCFRFSMTLEAVSCETFAPLLRQEQWI